jgi:hypothetical protein
MAKRLKQELRLLMDRNTPESSPNGKSRKYIRGVLPVILTLCCIAAPLSAQSIRYVNTRPTIGTQSVANTYMERIADNRYRQPGSGVTYNIEGNDFWLRYDKAPDADVKLGSIQRSGDRVLYYKDGNIAGYYTPADGRYYMATSEGDNVTKEAHIGVLVNNKLYSGEGEEQIRYTIDANFDPVVLGMFLLLQ